MGIAQVAIGAVLAAFASFGWLSVPLMALFMLAAGSASVLLTAGFNALIADLVPKQDLTSAMFLNSGQWNLARVIGPLLAAPIITWGSTALAFWLNTIAIGGLLVAVMKLRFPPRTWHAPHEPLREAVLNGVRAARNDAGIFSALALTALAGFFVAPLIGLVPVFALKVLHEGPAAASLLTAAQGCGAVVSAIVSASLLDRIGAGNWLRMTCGALTALAIAFWLAPSLAWALFAMLALGAAYLSLVTGTARVCLGRATKGAQARMAGLFHVTLDVTYAAGLMVAGAVADVAGLRQVGVASAVLFGVLLVALARSRRHLFTSLH
jgi:MFS family permease